MADRAHADHPTRNQPRERAGKTGGTLSRVAWFIGLWAASVVGMFVIAALIRLVLIPGS